MEKPRVLCVDDQYGVRMLMQEILKNEYHVELVETGQEAVALTQVFNPHLVIIDMKLEGMLGNEVLDNIKRIDKDIKSIMLTGYGDPESIVKICNTPPDIIMTKPFDIEEMKVNIRKLIDIEASYNIENIV